MKITDKGYFSVGIQLFNSGHSPLLSAHMRSLHNEDLELQIKLAKLQTDVQISVVACFTYLGLVGVFLIALQQTFLAIPESQTMMKYSFLAAFAVMAVFFFLIGRLYIKEIRGKRQEIIELKKQYVW